MVLNMYLRITSEDSVKNEYLHIQLLLLVIAKTLNGMDKNYHLL